MLCCVLADLSHIDIQQAIFRDKGSNLQSLDVNRRNARPRLGAPRKLDPKDLQAIMDGEERMFEDVCVALSPVQYKVS